MSTEFLTLADLTAWLAEYGVNLKDTKEVSFVPEGVGDENFPVRLKVRRLCRNADGKFFLDEERRQRGEGHHAAEEVLWIPLRSLPGLTERVA